MTFHIVKLRLAKLESDVHFPLWKVKLRVEDMAIIETIWVLAMLAGMGWWVKQDAEEYGRFRALTATEDRQRTYWRWIVQSFVILVGASVVSLWLAGALTEFGRFPAGFAPAHAALRPEIREPSGDTLLGMAIGGTVSILTAAFVQWRRLKRMMAPIDSTIEPMLPRNRREAAIALVLSVNAGFSEELFFRLALPLLLLDLTGSLWAAFGLAGIAFGCAHAYQGWKGVLGTMLVGALLTLIYLSRGSLLHVMALHAAIDVLAFIVRPAVSRRLARLGQRHAVSA